jgi:hypothetical protein
MMSIPVARKNQNGTQDSMLVRANCSQKVDEVAAVGISHGTFHKILFDDLNMSCVTQRSVPRILM